MGNNGLIYRAILIVGPTGSGKSPLGYLLEARGFKGKRCFHFDFGANLRQAAETSEPREPLTASDVETIRSVLDSGALLEDEQFHITKKILLGFISEKGVQQNDLIILNGLPRHVGQGEMLDSILKIEQVICLDCPAEVVYKRIHLNTGGDRTHRTDDSLTEIQNKLDIFNNRTTPLIEHYRDADAEVTHVNVGENTTAEEMLAELSC